MGLKANNICHSNTNLLNNNKRNNNTNESKDDAYNINRIMNNIDIITSNFIFIPENKIKSIDELYHLQNNENKKIKVISNEDENNLESVKKFVEDMRNSKFFIKKFYYI
jgi:hypothetical protein